MGGENYSNGITVWYYDGSALCNLNGKYKTLKCVFGPVDGSSGSPSSVTFLVDGKEVKTVELDKNKLPIEISVPLSYGLQLKIVNSGESNNIGLANMVLE